MTQREETVVLRDVEVTAIPYGDRLTLAKGSPVIVTQALGGAYTVITMNGYMVRIDGRDADALGREPEKGPSQEALRNRSPEQILWDQLHACYDPEIPIDIVELGLVHSAELVDRPEGGRKAVVRFNFTAPGCGMGDVLRRDIERKVLEVPGVVEADVQVQLDPPWDMSRMSDAARLTLGLM